MLRRLWLAGLFSLFSPLTATVHTLVYFALAEQSASREVAREGPPGKPKTGCLLAFMYGAGLMIAILFLAKLWQAVLRETRFAEFLRSVVMWMHQVY